MAAKSKIIIVGAGTAGITVAARLKRALKGKEASIQMIDPAETHYYQPLFTLVGGGASTIEETARPMASLIPKGVDWLKTKVTRFMPEQKQLECANGQKYSYDYLVVCPGIQINWQEITGFKDALGKNGVCSNYGPDTCSYTWQALQDFQGGNAIFTFPHSPLKCGGAPQKIMWLAQHYLEKKGLTDKSEIIFVSPAAAIFGVEKYRLALEALVKKRNIKTYFNSALVEVDGTKKLAKIKNLKSGEITEIPYNFIHVTPHQSAPDFIKESSLANEDGWLDLDKHNLRHKRYPNIFGLGDAAGVPAAKTGAAVRKQAPVLVSHLVAQIRSSQSQASYNGYSSCPLVTGYGRLILAEFDYDGKPVESFPFNQAKERLSMYILKKYLLPLIYWWGMLKGRM